ncbi:MAG: biopolymer transporter ExbD [Bdellovibrio sp. CG10_big_fil_rev_8_21_14_0_10_47_8]|nr:MAG: biopolymer transporter ExbD [Bdellovibrio sp. CG10_big_fil_rev_8_21_14_0_10_47_8]
MRKHSKHLDFEINLIPCIDLLSVCICFLLLTAVWLNVGSMNVKQAVGGQSVAETEKKPVLWVLMGTDGELNLNIQDSIRVPKNLSKLKLTGLDGKSNTSELQKVLEQIMTVEPALKTALIQPQAQSAYEDIIDLMDAFRKKGLVDLGVAPL